MRRGERYAHSVVQRSALVSEQHVILLQSLFFIQRPFCAYIKRRSQRKHYTNGRCSLLYILHLVCREVIFYNFSCTFSPWSTRRTAILTGNSLLLILSHIMPLSAGTSVKVIKVSFVIPVPNSRITALVPARIRGIPSSLWLGSFSAVSIRNPSICKSV